MSTSATTTSTHLDRKSLKRPDEFVTNVKSFFDVLADNSKIVFTVIGLMILAGAGFALWTTQQQERAGEAMSALYEARTAQESAYADLAKADSAKNSTAKKGEVPVTSPDQIRFRTLDVDAQLTGAISKYSAVIDRFPGTRAAFEARMSLGNLYFNHGQAAKALPHFELAGSSAPGSFERTMALNALAYAQEGAGKHNEAIQSFEQAMKADAQGTLKGSLLLGIARNHELAGNADLARATYDQILSQLPNTEHARTAELLKARLK